MKIGIVTIESFNLGNRLQNYALQQKLLEIGVDKVETIRRVKVNNGIKSKLKKLLQITLQTKNSKFLAFDKMINKSIFYADANNLSSDINNYFDYFVAGSDQIWNPNYEFTGSVDFLTFAKEEQRIFYAASIGVPELSEEKKKLYKQYLSGCNNISMREEEGANIVYELTGKKPTVVLDPTMLITAEEWRSVGKMPKGIDKTKKYALVYALGEKNQDFLNAISQCEYEVIDLRRKVHFGKEWAIGPMEFIWLIDNAEMIFTDSFHGTVFAILLNTPFRVFERKGEKMNGRIDTLLHTLSDCNGNVLEQSIQANFDFDEANKKLDLLRNKADSYLREALKL